MVLRITLILFMVTLSPVTFALDKKEAFESLKQQLKKSTREDYRLETDKGNYCTLKIVTYGYDEPAYITTFNISDIKKINVRTNHNRTLHIVDLNCESKHECIQHLMLRHFSENSYVHTDITFKSNSLADKAANAFSSLKNSCE